MQAARGGVRCGRPQVRRGRDHHSRTPTAREIEPALVELGLSGYAVAAAPTVKTHELDVPRIGYIHSWGNTQDEGWVRAALDYYKIPYTYFGENEVSKRNLSVSST